MTPIPERHIFSAKFLTGSKIEEGPIRAAGKLLSLIEKGEYAWSISSRTIYDRYGGSIFFGQQEIEVTSIVKMWDTWNNRPELVDLNALAPATTAEFMLYREELVRIYGLEQLTLDEQSLTVVVAFGKYCARVSLRDNYNQGILNDSARRIIGALLALPDEEIYRGFDAGVMALICRKSKNKKTQYLNVTVALPGEVLERGDPKILFPRSLIENSGPVNRDVVKILQHLEPKKRPVAVALLIP